MGSYGHHKQASYKRIILCADGTWLSSNIGTSAVPSNVAKIARAIAPTGIDKQGHLVRQVVFYHSGIGTGDLPFQQAIYGGLGWSLGHHVCQIYDFLANNYERGDEIFMFGFSRGAYTVRALAGLVSDVGVLNAVKMSSFPEMWKEYQKNTDGVPFRESPWYEDNKVKLDLADAPIQVVGVWETVGALGVPGWPIVKWLGEHAMPINKPYYYLNTKLSDNIRNAFQALALDEKRLTFPPSVWHKHPKNKTTVLEQCWFPGVHSNIGGQSELLEQWGDLQEIGYNTFAWMVDNCTGMLTFSSDAIHEICEKHKVALHSIEGHDRWGCGRIHDNFAFPDGTLFKILGQQTRTPGDYPQDQINHSIGDTNETFHPLVRLRRERLHTWNPPSLKDFSPDGPMPRHHHYTFTWTKPNLDPRIQEYVMEKHKKMSVVYKFKDGDTSKLEFREEGSLSRKLCPEEILHELDSANHKFRENGHH